MGRLADMTDVEQIRAELKEAKVDYSATASLDQLRDLLTASEGGLPATATRFPRGAGGGSGFSAGVSNKLLLTEPEAQKRKEQGRGIGDGDTFPAPLTHPNDRQLGYPTSRGSIELQMELLPKALAEKRAAGQGRSEPNQHPNLAEPVRETFSFKHPGQLMRTLLGPVYYAQFKAMWTFMMLLTICLLIGPHIVAQIFADETEEVVIGKTVHAVIDIPDGGLHVNVVTAPAPAHKP